MNTLTKIRDIIKHMIWVEAMGLSETYDILAVSRLDVRIPEE